LLRSRRQPTSALFPYTTLFRSNIDDDGAAVTRLELGTHTGTHLDAPAHKIPGGRTVDQLDLTMLDGDACILHAQTAQVESLKEQDRKSTRLNSSHVSISYAVFC